MAVTTQVVIGGANAMLHLPSWHAKDGAGLRGILACHGHGGKGLQIAQGGAFAGHPEYWADRGYLVGCIDTGDTWANVGAMAAHTALADYMRDTLGVTGKIGVVGWSMGGADGLRWILENMARVAVGWFCSPASDWDWFHANGYTAEMDAAYGGNYAANGAPRSPLANAATFRGGPRIQIAHAQNDPTALYSQTTAFLAAVNDPAVSLRQPDILIGGHQGGLTQVSPRETWEWLRTKWAA